MGTQLERQKVPEVGPHPKGLRTGNKGADPPPEDPRSADGVPLLTCLMDQMANYVASGWKRNLTHFIGCCWPAQIGSLDRGKWHVAITKFLGVMVKWKASDWTDIKELMPLQFMPYMARLFKEVTGQDLQGLSHFTGWIGQGGYYHWRVVQQGLIHLVPDLTRQPMLRTPDPHPCGKPLPPKPAQTETLSTGASGK